MPYLVDADWIINALAGRHDAVATLRQLAPEGLAVSWITVGELYEGALASPNPRGHLASLRRFLSPFRKLNPSDPIVERFAGIRFFLRRRGEVIPDFDIVVGATALHHDLTLLTRNARHLGRVPSLRLYQS